MNNTPTKHEIGVGYYFLFFLFCSLRLSGKFESNSKYNMNNTPTKHEIGVGYYFLFFLFCSLK